MQPLMALFICSQMMLSMEQRSQVLQKKTTYPSFKTGMEDYTLIGLIYVLPKIHLQMMKSKYNPFEPCAIVCAQITHQLTKII